MPFAIGARNVDSIPSRRGVMLQFVGLGAVREAVDDRPCPIVPEELSDCSAAIIFRFDRIKADAVVVLLAFRRQQHRYADLATVLERDDVGSKQDAGVKLALGGTLGPPQERHLASRPLETCSALRSTTTFAARGFNASRAAAMFL